MNLDPQIVRAEIILAAPRPQAEPDEAEVRRVLEHIGSTPEATATATAETATAEGGAA